MESFPHIVRSDNSVENIVHPPFVKDHRVSGKPVLPAVEAMENLAAAVAAAASGTAVTDITRAVFEKFLFLDPRANSTPASKRLDRQADGSVRATLQTKKRAPRAAITRTRVHAAMTFNPSGKPALSLPLDLAAAPEGICRTVEPEALYTELVPFGKAYRNIVKTLFLSKDSALAWVGSPRQPDGRKHLVLGSPYPLDAAFHAACAWAQYARNVVAFPVAVEHRKVVHPTNLDETYIARIMPIRGEGETLAFNIFIFDLQGKCREIATGVKMRDISGGHTTPPDWIKQKQGENLLTNILRRGTKPAIIERRSVAPFADETLSKDEKQRAAPMAPTRKNSFLAAHLALKRLSRELSVTDQPILPGDINTVRPNSTKPLCPVAGGSRQPYCSASHDNRFAVAVTAEHPVGIDVEQITAKALKNRNLFMHPAEERLTNHFAADEIEVAVRIWSAKEAVAKALDIPLAHAWDRVQLTAIGRHESRLQVMDRGAFTVTHDTVDGHLFTLFTLEPHETDTGETGARS